jgi:predicted acyl esterase
MRVGEIGDLRAAGARRGEARWLCFEKKEEEVKWRRKRREERRVEGDVRAAWPTADTWDAEWVSRASLAGWLACKRGNCF